MSDWEAQAAVWSAMTVEDGKWGALVTSLIAGWLLALPTPNFDQQSDRMAPSEGPSLRSLVTNPWKRLRPINDAELKSTKTSDAC